jgi:hydrogenase expression/formation protein HypD
MNESAWPQKFAEGLAKANLPPMTLMEVCGTHTMNIARYALRRLLPPSIKIVAGPGCPVCVTDPQDLALAFVAAADPQKIIATFGDVLRLPFGKKNLQQYSNVVAVNSPAAAVDLAVEHPTQEVIFLGIGFETTTPLTAAAIKQAAARGVQNFSVLSWHKRMIPALEFLLKQPALPLDGLILPGHVAAVTGSKYFDFLIGKKAAVISGFRAAEIMAAISALALLIKQHRPYVQNYYPQVVRPMGNPTALQILDEVFMPAAATWHGLGTLPASGFQLRPKWEAFDAQKKFKLVAPPVAPQACRCGEIMLGKITPPQCGLFGKACTPTYPQGPCMVSSEGTCAAYFKYQREGN